MLVNAQKLEIALARACLNIPQLAKKAELPYQTVKNAKMGKNVNPATVGKIAIALGVDPTDIVQMNGEEYEKA